MAPRFFEVFTARGRLRRAGRANRRMLKDSTKPEADRICARALNEAESVEEARLMAEQDARKAKIGFAEILIILQMISALYQLAKMMGWLKRASAAMIAKELAE